MTNTDNKIIEHYLKSHPTHAINMIEDFDDLEVTSLIASLSSQSAARIIERIVPYKVLKVLPHLDAEVSANIFSILPVKKSVSLLTRCDKSVIGKILPKLSVEIRETINFRMSFTHDSVGAHTDSSVLTLKADQKIRDSLKLVKKNLEAVQPQIYVLNQKDEITGFIELKELLVGDDERNINSIIKEKPMTFLPSISIEDLISQWDYRFIQLPVVDADDIFIGTISRKAIKDFAGQETVQKQPAFRAGNALSELYKIGFISLLGAGQDSYKNNQS